MVFIGTHDHWMRSRHDPIADQQLFVQFLPRSQPTELDGDIAVWIALRANAQAGKVNHFLSQLDYFHRFTHIQHENVSALPHRAGLDDQLRGFGNGHEVSGDFRMGDRQRSAGLDLFMKQRNDRA
ncbi:hypothetical protein D3C86_1833230 [compost metagenome]